MKKNVMLILLAAILSLVSILIVSCNLGGSNKFINLLGSGSIGSGGGTHNFPLFFDGQYNSDVEDFNSIVPTSDGGYFAVGRAYDNSVNPPIDDALFVKLDSNLNVVWSKLGSIGSYASFGFENIENGNIYYYGCGYTSGQNGYFISKLNSNGTTNSIRYFQDYITFILPSNGTNPGIIANINTFIAKFGQDLSFKWYINNAYWGDANFITSDNKTFVYFEDSNNNNNKYLVKINVSDDDVNNVINSAKYYQINNSSTNFEFLGGLGDYNNNFYFGFLDYNTSPDKYYLIKTDNYLGNKKEVSVDGSFAVSLVPEPNTNTNNVILLLFDNNSNPNKLYLVKLDGNLTPISNMSFEVNNYYPGYKAGPLNEQTIKAIPLSNFFLVPGGYNGNALVYSFNYNLQPPCGNLSSSNITLKNTDDISIDNNPTTLSSGLTSGNLTLNPSDTVTTDYPLNVID
ncbi:MAG: hypothetical protein ACP5O4_01085, partial [bacterium]